MKSSFISRLDKQFAGASALAAAAGVAGTVQQANANIVYSGAVSINIPSTTAGVYLNVVTGVNNVSPAAVPGWDVNPWSTTGVGLFAPTAPTGGVYVTTTAGGTQAVNMTAGATIDATSFYGTNSSATANSTVFNVNSSDNLVGFRFQNEANGNAIHYGWMRISLGATTGGQPRAIVEYAYEDAAGVGIAAGATASGPTGACCVPSTLSCVVTSTATCTTTLGGVYNGDGSTCAQANCPTPGACCMNDGTCAQTTGAACATAHGVYHGDSSQCAGANCPPAGACCTSLGQCTSYTAGACASIGGVYHGDGSTCATTSCPGGATMNCNIPGTFTDISATGTVITISNGTTDDGSGAFTSSVTNALVTNPNLFATTNGFITDLSTYYAFGNLTLPLTVAGLNMGLFPNWDDLYDDAPGTILHQAVVENGVNVEIVQWNQVRTFAGGTTGPRGTFEVKIFGAGGPAIAQYLYQSMAWDGNGASSTVGVQWTASLAYQASTNTAGSIADGQVCSVVQITAPSACYANCDLSTSQPCLNVLDFSCFLNAFAAGNTYANCDNSTTQPTLNVLDFSCFLNAFAAGCSSC